MSKARASDIHAKDYANDPSYRRAYDNLEDEYTLINSLIEVRIFLKPNRPSAGTGRKLQSPVWKAAGRCPRRAR